jgi:hypothetical protein
MEHNQSNLGLDQCHDCGVRRKQVANPTTYYGFVLPTPTDLVTDLPADFDVALQGVDTRLKALQPGTTLGDLAYSSATANTNTRLAIGSSNQVLGVVAGVPAWIDPDNIASTYTAKTASYTFASGDEGNIFSMNNAATQQFNIPTDATFNFAIGTEINVFWITGAGQPTIGAVTPGTTTVISTGATSATPALRVANSGATCKKLAANSWIVFGDIE